MELMASVLLTITLTTQYSTVMRGRDYVGTIKVRSVDISDAVGANAKTLLVDADGDGQRDTLDVFFEQTAHRVTLRDGAERPIIAWFEPGETEVQLEYARAFLLGPDKPVMLFCFIQGLASGNQLIIVDVVRTATGRKSYTLFDDSAGWSNCPIVFNPNAIEIRHFRGWPEARYLWSKDKFVSVPVEP